MKAELNVSVKGSVGALAGTNGQCAFQVVFYPAEAVKRHTVPRAVIWQCPLRCPVHER